jgi:hypothetical protein
MMVSLSELGCNCPVLLVDLYLINKMFLYVNIKHYFTCVRTESYNVHCEIGTSLYTPSLEHIFHKHAPPQECYYKILEFHAVEGTGYNIIPHCKKSLELFLLIYSNRHFYLVTVKLLIE